MQDGVRFAETDEDFSASYQLRYKVYVECMGRLKDKGDHVLKELRDEYDKNARAVIAIKDGEPIGTLRLFWGGDATFSQTLIEAYHLTPFMEFLDEKQICIVERLMVDEKHRGSTATLRMYKEVMHFVLNHHIEAVLLDCEPHHLNSYLKLGFRPFTETYSYPGIGLVVPMVLISGDYEHLKRVGSPFGMLTREEDLSHCRHTKQLLNLIESQRNVLSQSGCNQSDFLQHIYADPSLLANTKPKIFDSLSTDEIQRVIEKSHIIECNLGGHIIEKDNAAKTMFILLSGIVEVRRDGELQAVISPGEMIGEIAFFLKTPRSASIIAATDEVKILSLDEPSMSRLLKYESELANKVLMNLCRSLCSRVISGVETSDLRAR
ncbi:GNAT family N-acetyltransferase [Methylomarinum sp. Ch1-1]|uniref:GNAT family N-acetyltransferase n=1 Tax=Methylomarinum roseum TaxID=3067653 RepID=A0AAU7NPG8_9GAMM